jgi:penicillin amidase
MRPRLGVLPLALPVLGALLYAGGCPVGPLPPLGPFLDPANGAWAAARTADLPRRADARIPGLGDSVRVVYDDRAVPHIFAATEEDAYRALGYVVARDRLFQLELQTRATAGTLTELAGPAALPLDQEARRLGLAWSARRKFAATPASSVGRRAVEAYAQGVNAYIDGMRPAEMPIEYRLLGATPMRWRPEYSSYLLARMAWTLSYDDPELSKLEAQARVGRAAADALYPQNSPIQEPIQPSGAPGPRFDLARLPPPGAPDTAARSLLGEVASAPRRSPPAGVLARDGDALGSNNWAVSPRRTRAGHALLAGDPHLELSLPSVWYEAHLVVPGRLDAYGVTIPGAPAIILGFNRDVAWTFTNTGADVVDFYAETVDDTLQPSRYRVDGAWHPLERRVERYRGKRGEVIGTDTLYVTHRGPVLRERGAWLSVRWTEHHSSSESDALVDAPHARSVEQWQRAMERFAVPAQNMLVADRAGTIAIRSQGRFPRRENGSGADVRDGATTATDWGGFLPVAAAPYARDPAQGYLASANQQPVDPIVSPTYLGASWPDPWRAMRINALLRADSGVTPDAMRRFQTDPGSARADYFVPELLGAARRETAAGRGDSVLSAAADLLAQWDRRYTRESERAVLFEYAMSDLQDRLWDELREPARRRGGGGVRVRLPNGAAIAQLLDDPTSDWWDDRRTPAVREGRDAILAASLRAALARAVATHGPPDGGGWRWSGIRQANIYHLLGLPAFSALKLPVQGGPSTLSPSNGSGSFGASWRMVVELGPEVRAWAIYPGGQSGNPASARYADRLPRWLAGQLDEVRFPRRSSELDPRHTSARLTLSGGK